MSRRRQGLPPRKWRNSNLDPGTRPDARLEGRGSGQSRDVNLERSPLASSRTSACSARARPPARLEVHLDATSRPATAPWDHRATQVRGRFWCGEPPRTSPRGSFTCRVRRVEWRGRSSSLTASYPAGPEAGKPLGWRPLWHGPGEGLRQTDREAFGRRTNPVVTKGPIAAAPSASRGRNGPPDERPVEMRRRRPDRVPLKRPLRDL